MKQLLLLVAIYSLIYNQTQKQKRAVKEKSLSKKENGISAQPGSIVFANRLDSIPARIDARPVASTYVNDLVYD